MNRTRSLIGRALVAWLALAVPVAVAMHLLTDALFGANYRSPTLAAVGCAWCGVLLTLVLARTNLSKALTLCAPIVALIPAGQCWRHVPTADGWSNAQADDAADRVVARLTDPRKFAPADLGTVWSDADRLTAHYPLQAAPVRAARDSWEARLDERLRNLESGRTPAGSFEGEFAALTRIAAQVPPYRERIQTAERAWCEGSIGRLTTRLDTLASGADLRTPEQSFVIGLLEQRAPDLLKRLAAAEIAWVERTEVELAAAVRTAPPTDPGAFLARRASADAFLVKHKRPDAAARAAELEWHRRCVEHGLAEGARLEATDPTAAADALCATADRLARSRVGDPFPTHLRTALARTVARALDDGRRQVREAIRADRYAGAAGIADRLAARLRLGADRIGLSTELDALRASCRFLAELAVESGATDPP